MPALWILCLLTRLPCTDGAWSAVTARQAVYATGLGGAAPGGYDRRAVPTPIWVPVSREGGGRIPVGLGTLLASKARAGAKLFCSERAAGKGLRKH